MFATEGGRFAYIAAYSPRSILRKMYGRMPPWRYCSISSALSMRTIAWNERLGAESSLDGADGDVLAGDQVFFEAVDVVHLLAGQLQRLRGSRRAWNCSGSTPMPMRFERWMRS